MELKEFEARLKANNVSVMRVRFVKGSWKVAIQYSMPSISNTLYSFGTGTTLEEAITQLLAKVVPS